ncbi:PhzA/PhzB family protein [Streptomyces cellulosae]
MAPLIQSAIKTTDRGNVVSESVNSQGFSDEVELRRINRATVERYMKTRGQDRLRRHELFTEDGVGGLWTTDTGEPVATHGRDRLAEHAVWSLKCFPDWEWYNIQIFETQDPNHFWVECDGRGKILFGDYPEGYYENHFLHSFELDVREGLVSVRDGLWCSSSPRAPRRHGSGQCLRGELCVGRVSGLRPPARPG